MVERVLKRLLGFGILKSFVGFECVLEGFGCGGRGSVSSLMSTTMKLT